METTLYLADTHCLMWFQENNAQMPKRVMEIMQNPENRILFTQISLLEIAIKQSIGKLPSFVASVNEIYEQSIKDQLSFLPISNNHIATYHKVPLYEQHRDPFDRLLIATAMYENATILSADKNFKLYGDFINLVW